GYEPVARGTRPAGGSGRRRGRRGGRRRRTLNLAHPAVERVTDKEVARARQRQPGGAVELRRGGRSTVALVTADPVARHCLDDVVRGGLRVETALLEGGDGLARQVHAPDRIGQRVRDVEVPQRVRRYTPRLVELSLSRRSPVTR